MRSARPLENIDAHHALAADAKARGPIKAFGDGSVGGEGGAPGGREMRHFLEALHIVEPAVLERPKQGGERARRGLQQQGQIEMIGAEAHAELAQSRAVVLR